MKGKKYYLILIGLVIVGIGSVFLYREQREAKILEFEGYEISAIEASVDALYNEEKTDISNDIAEEELEELESTFSELHEKDLSRRSKDRINNMEHDFVTAKEMLNLEAEVDGLFIEMDIVDENTTINQVDDLERQVLVYEMKTEYVDRNIEKLTYARKQINEIKTATEFIDNLFEEEDVVREGVTREDEEEAFERIEPIRNEEVRNELIDRMEIINVVLTEREEALAQELEELEQEEQEEEIEDEIGEPESTPTNPGWDNDESGSNGSGGANNGGSTDSTGDYDNEDSGNDSIENPGEDGDTNLDPDTGGGGGTDSDDNSDTGPGGDGGTNPGDSSGDDPDGEGGTDPDDGSDPNAGDGGTDTGNESEDVSDGTDESQSENEGQN